MKKSLLVCAFFCTFVLSLAGQQNREALSPKGLDRITREVRHELVMLPFYGVFAG